MSGEETREALALVTGDALQKAYLHGVVSVTHGSDPRGVPVSYPDATAATDRVMEVADVYASVTAVEDHEATARAGAAFPAQEPPTGSVVAINWGSPYQEVWVANSANIGNWYTPDIPLRGDAHPTWYDVIRRAEGRTLTLLVAGHADTYAAGWQAAIDATSEAVRAAIENLPPAPPEPQS